MICWGNDDPLEQIMYTVLPSSENTLSEEVQEVNHEATGFHFVWLLDISSGEADKTPSFAQQSVLDQGTSILGMASAAGNKEVPVSLCIVCKKFKVNCYTNIYGKCKIKSKAAIILILNTFYIKILIFIHSLFRASCCVIIKQHRKTNVVLYKSTVRDFLEDDRLLH